MEKESIITREELIQLFENNSIIDTGKGWIMEGVKIDIIALHDIEPKFLQDVTRASSYKIVFKENQQKMNYYGV